MSLLKKLFKKVENDPIFEKHLLAVLGDKNFTFLQKATRIEKSVKNIYFVMSQAYKRNENPVTFSVPKMNKLFDKLRVCFNTRILDFYGGNGLMAALIAHQYNVKCVDVCDFHDGSQIVKSNHTRYTQMWSTGKLLPYRDNTFDIVSCFMIPYVNNDMINQLFRVTKKWLVVHEYSDSINSNYLLKAMDMMNKHVYKLNHFNTVVNKWIDLVRGKFILTKKYKTTNYPVPIFVYIFKKVTELEVPAEWK